MNAIVYGVLAALFFSTTFIINRLMELSGGSWVWSAVLRHVFMAALLLPFMFSKNRWHNLLQEMRRNLKAWFIWSTIGFGLFYSCITFGAAYGPAWLMAGTFQFTIIAGILLTPLFFEERKTKEGIVKVRKKIPLKALAISSIIFLGVILIQLENAGTVSLKEVLLCVVPVTLAAFFYPLGNRMMMEVTKARVDAISRVFGMTIMSMPYWFILSLYGLKTVGLPSSAQTIQCLLVALSAGIIATILFFKATNLVKDNPQQLAVIEGTIALELIFTFIVEILFLGASLPSKIGIVGIAMVFGGIILNNYLTFINHNGGKVTKKIKYANN